MLLLLIIIWLLLSPIELFIDTKVSELYVRWIGIGRAMIVYEKEDWWLKVQFSLFKKKWSLIEMVTKSTKKGKKAKPTRKKTIKKKNWLPKILNMLKTFRITKWQIAIDSGNNVINAWMYPLNFFPYTYQHLFVNFNEENYLALIIRNVPLRMLYAWIK
jgi:hypothetical protein